MLCVGDPLLVLVIPQLKHTWFKWSTPCQGLQELDIDPFIGITFLEGALHQKIKIYSVFYIHYSKGWTWNLELWAMEELLSNPVGIILETLQQSYGRKHQKYYSFVLLITCHFALARSPVPSSPDLSDDDGIKTETCTQALSLAYSKPENIHASTHTGTHTELQDNTKVMASLPFLCSQLKHTAFHCMIQH